MGGAKCEKTISIPFDSFRSCYYFWVDDREVFIYEELQGDAMILSEEEVISKSLQSSYFGFDTEISGIEVGDKVKVWYDAIDASLPGSGHGTKIELINK